MKKRITESQLRRIIRESINEYYTSDNMPFMRQSDYRSSRSRSSYDSDYERTPKQKKFIQGNGKIDYNAIKLSASIPELVKGLQSVLPRCKNDRQYSSLEKTIEKLNYIENYIRQYVDNMSNGGNGQYGLVAEGFFSNLRSKFSNMFGNSDAEEDEMPTIDFYSLLNGIKNIYPLTSTLQDKKIMRSIQAYLRNAYAIVDDIRR